MTLKLEDPLGAAPVSDAEQHRANNRKLETAVNDMALSVMKTLYPVGGLYVSTLSTNPGTLLGFGTWSAFGAGRTMVSLDAGQVEFDVVEETGGEKTHVLTTAESPSHTHGVGTLATASTGRVDTTVNWRTNTAGGGASTRVSDIQGLTGDGGTGTGNLVSATDHTHTMSGSTGSQGSDTAHNNLQPYIVVYMWKRTA